MKIIVTNKINMNKKRFSAVLLQYTETIVKKKKSASPYFAIILPFFKAITFFFQQKSIFLCQA
jgi:hypothetical protein